MKRRAEGQAMSRPEGPAPLCPCHSEPMYWHRDAGHKDGGRWRCAVKRREYDRRYDRRRRREGQAMPRPEGPAPLCPCHSEPMRWSRDVRCKDGGYWYCAVKKREYDRRRRAEGQAMPRPEGPAPLCPCHSELMYWCKDAGRKNGGYWYCAVKARERDRKRRQQPHKCYRRGCTRMAVVWTTGYVDSFCWLHRERHNAHMYLNRLEKQWAAAEGWPWPPPVAEPDRSTSITWETRPVPPLPPTTRLNFRVVRRWPISDMVEQGKEE